MRCCLPRTTTAGLLREQGAGGSVMSGPAGGGTELRRAPGGLLTHPVSAGLLNLPLSPVWEPAWALASWWAPRPNRQKQAA